MQYKQLKLKLNWHLLNCRYKLKTWYNYFQLFHLLGQ